MDAGKRTLNDIFNGNRILDIPFFQRSYVWDEPQWSRFLDDMELITERNTIHFLGSVILKQTLTPSDSKAGDVRILIDGQQRLTTFNIFFKVLGLIKDDKFLKNIFRLQRHDECLALQHNHNDIEAFERIMNLDKLEDLSEKKDSISKAYTYFKDHIDVSKLDDQKILNNVLFVGIDVGENENEQQIFDTINSLGVSLTTAELLKNYFFNRDVASYKEYWEEVFEKDEDEKNYWDKFITTGRIKRSIIDIFFYAFLQIKIQENEAILSDDKIAFSRVDDLFESYKSYIKKYNVDKTQLLENVKEYALIFRKNIDDSVLNRDLTNKSGLDRINGLIFGMDCTTLIPYVLYLLKNQNNTDECNAIFDYLEAYLMRRIIVHATNKNYNQLFLRFIPRKLLTREDVVDFIDEQLETGNYMPNDQEIRYEIDNHVFINKIATGILYYLESKIRDRKKSSTLLLGLNGYSLEHMMPKKWRNHWSSPKHPEERDRKLKLLGNLTIITQSLNTSIRDAEWKVKLAGKGDNNGLMQNASGITITTDYLKLEDWNEIEIQKRADFLYNKIVDVWKVENPKPFYDEKHPKKSDEEIVRFVWDELKKMAAEKRCCCYSELRDKICDEFEHHYSCQNMRLFLLPINDYCEKNGLPKLNMLVVSKTSKKPGAGLHLDENADVESLLQQVFDYDWNSVGEMV